MRRALTLWCGLVFAVLAVVVNANDCAAEATKAARESCEAGIGVVTFFALIAAGAGYLVLRFFWWLAAE